jgi:Xaa-Pro aminopeptidase
MPKSFAFSEPSTGLAMADKPSARVAPLPSPTGTGGISPRGSRHTRWRALWTLGLMSLGVAASPPAHAQVPDSATYRSRREHLAQAAKDGIVIIQGVPRLQAGITEYLIDDSDNHDFLYLTGLESPTATLLLLPQSTAVPEILFVPPDEIDQARARTGIKTVLSDERLTTFLSEALTDYSIKRFSERIRKPVSTEMARVLSLTPKKVVSVNYPRYMNLGADVPARVQLAERIRSYSPAVELRDITPALTAMRIRHDPAELNLIAQVVHIGVDGMIAALRACKPGAYDYQVDATADYVFKQEGAARMAYPPLTYISPFGRPIQALSAAEVGKSFEPTSAVHQMQAGDLVMVDAGAEYHHYASDLSRTVPVSGKFTPEQRRIYDAVLAAHHAAVAAIRPGATFRQVHDAAVAQLRAQGLDRYFTFGTSHFIGMDGHDAGNYDEPLEPGMIFTVEPGIIDNEKNITVHVEDMILVTPTGHRNLSEAIPIEAADIEKLMSQK